jgi:phosphoribosylformylglycinamidine synthase I
VRTLHAVPVSREDRALRSAVVVFPGSNRERDVARALESVTGVAPDMVWHAETELPPADLIVLPGGFSYGDYLRSGAIAARAPIMRDVAAKAESGVPVLGICNGFQVLTEARLLPGALMRNAHLRFVCRDVFLRVERNDTLFTTRYRLAQVIRTPVAHGDGNYFADEATLHRLEGEGQVVFRYCTAEGDSTPAANPNGSQRNIAGIVNRRGNVLGLMPHPENLIDPALGGTEGRGIFESLLDAAGGAARLRAFSGSA